MQLYGIFNNQLTNEEDKRATKFRVSKTLDGSRQSPCSHPNPLGSYRSPTLVRSKMSERNRAACKPGRRPGQRTQVHVAPSGRVDLDPSHFRPAGRMPRARERTPRSILRDSSRPRRTASSWLEARDLAQDRIFRLPKQRYFHLQVCHHVSVTTKHGILHKYMCELQYVVSLFLQ